MKRNHAKTASHPDYGPTRYQEGDFVRARYAVQNMALATTYEVVEVAIQDTPFGGFVTYWLAGADGKAFPVGNGHLVLERAYPPTGTPN